MRTVLVLALSLAAAACSSKSTSISNDEARQLLLDRNWLDQMPRTERDKLHVYRFVPKMGGGVFQDRTLYKGTFELFTFKTDGDQILFDLPETHEKVASKFHIKRVDGPHPFDLELTIENDPRGPTTYYGMRSETAELRDMLAR